MQGFRAEILECFHDSRRNCKGIWKRSSFYRLGRRGGGGGGGGVGNYKTTDPDFVFKVPFFAFTIRCRNFIKKRNAARTTRTIARIARTRIL